MPCALSLILFLLFVRYFLVKQRNVLRNIHMTVIKPGLIATGATSSAGFFHIISVNLHKTETINAYFYVGAI